MPHQSSLSQIQHTRPVSSGHGPVSTSSCTAPLIAVSVTTSAETVPDSRSSQSCRHLNWRRRRAHASPAAYDARMQSTTSRRRRPQRRWQYIYCWWSALRMTSARLTQAVNTGDAPPWWLLLRMPHAVTAMASYLPFVFVTSPPYKNHRALLTASHGGNNLKNHSDGNAGNMTA
ncbi:hypothetical protein E2562_039529 [Oryza meyeriana var. granulata]|uniref:Uncharacterized protein n=1 Tax=Oryza meyeriana var. granulata TaxID=110450 RepID=A0A6G1C2S9_9ORYZ|nr:hypothetical protein E2562_039529 [Oryza meyeriana var. granulata]